MQYCRVSGCIQIFAAFSCIAFIFVVSNKFQKPLVTGHVMTSHQKWHEIPFDYFRSQITLCSTRCRFRVRRSPTHRRLRSAVRRSDCRRRRRTGEGAAGRRRDRRRSPGGRRRSVAGRAISSIGRRKEGRRSPTTLSPITSSPPSSPRTHRRPLSPEPNSVPHIKSSCAGRV